MGDDAVVFEDPPTQTMERGEIFRNGLAQLGKHPILLSHVFLQMNVKSKGLDSLELLTNYPNLMYVDISDNRISDVRVLAELPMLVELNASRNCLTECLDFSPLLCTHDNAWSSGDEAVGSMLTLANLSFNKISQLNDLGAHPFLEVLLLSNNDISRIQGLESLMYLQVLDLSYNKILAIGGLDGLRIQELNLEGNRLTSAAGLENLPNLTALNLSYNAIRSLSSLAACSKLLTLNVGHNDILVIKQTRFLQDIPWLAYLTVAGNPCCKKTNYRCRVLYQLRNLRRLDASNVTAEEQIRTCNLYRIQGGDLAARESVFAKHFPGEAFEDFGPTSQFEDDEMDLELEEDGESSLSGVAAGLSRELYRDITENIIKQIISGRGGDQT